MSPTRRLIHGITLLAAGVIALFVLVRSPGFAEGQQLGQGMVRTGIVGIANETERKLFFSLICTCGCPRESLGTCTCGFAHERRDELRALLAEGLSIGEIQTRYAGRFGPQALAVPPNEGGNRLLYLFPIGAIVLGAGLVIVAVRRWRDRSAAGGGPEPEGADARGKRGKQKKGEAARDEYDDKLDEELRDLDRE
ncbi:MAG: cytochrome c-type biogenesis protein CcmH [Polyangiaceae bacterium]|nr:cytochrome c-type biogenesis protein CcmH [Polyangiaceae bacterium]